MARITNMLKGMQPIWIHDVTHPVGLHWFNYKDDVKLVQYALNKIMAKDSLPDVSAKATPGPFYAIYPPLPPLGVDGIFGKKSHAALLAFQRASYLGSRSVLADGQVDPVYKYIARGGGDPLGIDLMIRTQVEGFTMYRIAKTILKLYGRLMDDSELPPDVQIALHAS
jgi:hypothetical protein